MAYTVYDSYTTSDGTKYVGMYSDNRTQIYKEDADGNKTILSSSKRGGKRKAANRKKVGQEFDTFKTALEKAETGEQLTYTDEDVTEGGGGFLKKDTASTLTLSDGTVLATAAGKTSDEIKTLKALADEVGAVSIANKPDEETSNDTTDETTVLDETTDTALDTVEEISEATFGGSNTSNDSGSEQTFGDGQEEQEEGEVNPTDDIANYFDNTLTSVNSAAAQQQNQASALTTSVGEAEDDAISYMTSGTGSNILNPGGAQGLLAGDDKDEFDPFNRRKTLIGA